MISPATNRQFLLELARATLEALHDAPSSLEAIDDVHPDAVKNSLEAASTGPGWREPPQPRSQSRGPSEENHTSLTIKRFRYCKVPTRSTSRAAELQNYPSIQMIPTGKQLRKKRSKQPPAASTLSSHTGTSIASAMICRSTPWSHSFRIGAPGKQRRNASCSRSLQHIRLMQFILEISIIPELRKSHGSTSLTSSNSMVRHRTPAVISRWRETMITTVADMVILTLSFPLYDRKRATLICGTTNGRSSG
jgi:hypothetical protein